MTKIDLGRIGAALGMGDGTAFVSTAVELEELGYATIWTGGQLANLGQVAELVRGTRRVRVANGILSVDQFDSDAVSKLYADLEATHPGRLVVGLGGARGPHPFQTLSAYLDRLSSVPVSRRVLAALGPRMLDFARQRAAGAYPVLVTPDYTAGARSVLGDTTLAIDQLFVLETDAERARSLARVPLGFLGTLPAYQANFRRMGFSEEEIVGLGDRLVDSLVAWGSAETIAARVVEHLDAGADHVALSLNTDRPETAARDQWRQLASALIS